METNKKTTHEEIGTINPFIGMWMTDYQDDTEMVISNMHFLEKTFLYCIIRLNKNGEENSRLIYNGTYKYNTISNIIFFEVEKPKSETGITSSSYIFYEDKLYCYGNKIFITEKLHSKIDISKYTN
jgi:hypothetical protein